MLIAVLKCIVWMNFVIGDVLNSLNSSAIQCNHQMTVSWPRQTRRGSEHQQQQGLFTLLTTRPVDRSNCILIAQYNKTVICCPVQYHRPEVVFSIIRGTVALLWCGSLTHRNWRLADKWIPYVYALYRLSVWHWCKIDVRQCCCQKYYCDRQCSQ